MLRLLRTLDPDNKTEKLTSFYEAIATDSIQSEHITPKPLQLIRLLAIVFDLF